MGIKKEYKSIIRNKKLLISLIAILFLPMIYAGIFASSMWDPYGRTDKIPVAVVNEDVGVTKDNETINIGSSLVKNLEENKDFAWNFVSREEADKGVSGETYYMAMYINKDFTERSLKEGTEIIPLEYKVNPAKSYSGYLMTKTGANAISANLNKKITKSYIEAIAGNLSSLKSKLGSAKEGTEKLVVGSEQLNSGILSLNGGINSLKNGQSIMFEKVNEARNKYSQINDGLNNVNNKIPDLQNGQQSLAIGLSKLKQGSGELVNNGNLLRGGISSLSSGITELNSGLQQSIGKINTKENEEKLSQLQQASTTIQNALDRLEKGTTSMNNSIEELNKNVPSLEELQNIKVMLTSGSKGSINLNNISVSEEQIILANNLYEDTLKNNPTFANLTEEQQNSILISIQGTTQKVLIENLNSLKMIVDQNIDNEKLNSGTNQDGVLKLVASLEKIRYGLDNGLVSGANSTSLGLQQVAANYKNIDSGINQLIDNTKKSQNSLNTLVGSVAKLNTGATELNQKYSQYNNGVAKLDEGISSAKDGNAKLLIGTNTLQKGINNLTEGSIMFSNQFFPQLNSGLVQLMDGTDQLGEGTSKLSSGSSELLRGLTSLNEGVSNGVATLENNTLENKVEFITTPTETKQLTMNGVDNYGTLFIAYLIPLGLYIASIAFNFVYTMTSSSDYKFSRKKKWHRGKLLVMIVQGILQAVLTGVLMQLILGVSPENTVDFYKVLLITSLAYITLVTLFTITMGNIGRFISIIFLVLQLASAGGTFPIETSSSFFQKLHNYLPMTRSLQGLQHSIAGGLDSNYQYSIIYLTVMFVVSLICVRLYYLYNEKHRKININLFNK